MEGVRWSEAFKGGSVRWVGGERDSPANVDLLATTHSDRLATRVRELLDGEGEAAADCFKEAEERSLRLKKAFCDRFVPAREGAGV